MSFSIVPSITGRYVYHPFLPEVTETDDPPVYTEFSALEREPSVIEHVMKPMLM